MKRCTTCGRSTRDVSTCYRCKRKDPENRSAANRVRAFKRKQRMEKARRLSVLYYLRLATIEELALEAARRGYSMLEASDT